MHPSPRASPRTRAAVAQAAITADPTSPEPWIALAVAFYNLRRYDHAIPATSAALSLASSPDTRRKLRHLLRSSVLLSRLRHSSNPTPTARLLSGWYKTRLTSLIDAGRLQPFPTVAELLNDPQLAAATSQACVIVRRPSGEYHTDWDEVETDDGGLRAFPSTVLQGFPLDQITGGYIYLKSRVSSFRCYCYDGNVPSPDCEWCCPEDTDLPIEFLQADLPIPVYHFPKLHLALPSRLQIVGGPLLSVHVANGLVSEDVRIVLAEQLGRLGRLRPDSPMPKYHNIIDPNIGAVDGLWVPTEFDVEQVPLEELMRIVESAIRQHTAGQTVPSEVLESIHHLCESTSYATCVMRSDIPDVDPHRYSTLYVAIEHVLHAALPLLANLRLPALLLPGPLQVVVKAQRIVLDPDDSYEGAWHEDGLREHVVAIVLYYYGISPSLVGGGMEFLSKRRMKLFVGDDSGNYFDTNGVRNAIGEMGRCIVPVTQGTMLVFSNYAAVHRVLPMLAKEECGSRDFLAFFIIDQKHPLPVPDTLGPRTERIIRRAEMLREQLQVCGHFGLDGTEVTCTGNGCLSDLAWISSGDVFPAQLGSFQDYWEDEPALAIVSRLNMAPPVLGRGSSFLTSLDLPAAQFNPASSWMLHILQDEPRTQAFVDTVKMYYTSALPENGIRAVKIFENVEQWLELGCWTDDDNLRESIAAESRRELNSREEN